MMEFREKRKTNVILALSENFPDVIQEEFVKLYYITLVGNPWKAAYRIMSDQVKDFVWSSIPLWLMPKWFKEKLMS